jgi:transcriptional antiterminator RfaH
MTLRNDQNPDALFPPDILTAEQSDSPWRLAHTKSRREKALAHYLRRCGISYYLPMIRKRQPGNARIRFSMVPAFAGYLFFRADDEQRHAALRSNHIGRVIDVADEQKLVYELQQIAKVLSCESDARDTRVYPYDFVGPQQWVRVKTGPFKGVEGQIVRKEGGYRLVLLVEMIMQSISISIDSYQVEPMI